MWGKSPHIFCYYGFLRNVNTALEALVTQELEALGFELFDLRIGGSRSRPSLQVRIDRRDQGPVTVDDCVRASRAIEARLDAEGAVGERYALEVSSPGVERPLRHAGDWRRFLGQRASVVSDALGGRQEVELLAVDGPAGTESVMVRTESGEERRIPLADVREARLAFHW